MAQSPLNIMWPVGAFSCGAFALSHRLGTYCGREQNIDNLKAGVVQADWYDPEINPKLEEFARYYGTVILPTKPVMPRHKGKVEAGVKYLKPDLVIIDDMGLKALPKQSGEYLLEVIMRRYENRSTIMTSALQPSALHQACEEEDCAANFTACGTCYRGGTNDSGTVFAINTDGTGFRVVHTFPAYSAPPDYTNSDGGGLFSGLALSGNTLYGVAYTGGSFGNGTLFALNTDGTGFTNLHNFTGGSDGRHPIGKLVLSGSTLYGTSRGGSSGSGTVFAINTNGTSFTILHSFTALLVNSSPFLLSTNSDGATPTGVLFLSGNTLYGMASGGGTSGNGNVFSVKVDGTEFTTVYDFTGGTDGANPLGGLILSGNTLYGTAYWGGAFDSGTVFSISLPPQLTITPSGSNLILSWPTNLTGYTLRSTTNLTSPLWTTNLPGPVVMNGFYTITNPASGTPQFFRLAQ